MCLTMLVELDSNLKHCSCIDSSELYLDSDLTTLNKFSFHLHSKLKYFESSYSFMFCALSVAVNEDMKGLSVNVL